MAKSYRKADAETEQMVAAVMEKYHGDLIAVEVTIYTRFITSDKSPALKLHGYPCTATIRRNPAEKRADGVADATLTIDKAEWDDLDADGRLACLNHELTHLEVARSKKTGGVQFDDAGRPKLKMKLHDLVVGGFKSIVAIHGEAALEFKHVQAVNEALRQQEFAFG